MRVRESRPNVEWRSPCGRPRLLTKVLAVVSAATRVCSQHDAWMRRRHTRSEMISVTTPPAAPDQTPPTSPDLASVPPGSTWVRRVRPRLWHPTSPLPPVQPIHVSPPPRHYDVDPPPHPHDPATHALLHVPAETMAEGFTAGLEALHPHHPPRGKVARQARKQARQTGTVKGGDAAE